jgi:uncharacterized UBP type Zn finger protein
VWHPDGSFLSCGLKLKYKPLINIYNMPVNQHAYYIMVALGLEENASYRSLLAVGGESIDKALDWLEEHMDDLDIHEPILKRFLD